MEGRVICEPEPATLSPTPLLSISHCYAASGRGRLPRTLDFKRYPFSFYYLPSSSTRGSVRWQRAAMRRRVEPISHCIDFSI